MKAPTPATEPDEVKDNTWDPAPGESLAGVVDNRETFKRKSDGEPFEVLSVRDEDEQIVRVLCGRAHLKALVAEHDPRPGDGIAISFFGQQPGGQRFLYALRVEKAGRADVDAEAAGFEAAESQDAELARIAQEPLGVE